MQIEVLVTSVKVQVCKYMHWVDGGSNKCEGAPTLQPTICQLPNCQLLTMLSCPLEIPICQYQCLLEEEKTNINHLLVGHGSGFSITSCWLFKRPIRRKRFRITNCLQQRIASKNCSMYLQYTIDSNTRQSNINIQNVSLDIFGVTN